MKSRSTRSSAYSRSPPAKASFSPRVGAGRISGDAEYRWRSPRIRHKSPTDSGDGDLDVSIAYPAAQKWLIRRGRAAGDGAIAEPERTAVPGTHHALRAGDTDNRAVAERSTFVGTGRDHRRDPGMIADQ